MKRLIFITLFLAALAASPLRAQNTGEESAVDSLVYVRAASMDASLSGKDIFNYVNVHQSQALSDAMRSKIERNKDKDKEKQGHNQTYSQRRLSYISVLKIITDRNSQSNQYKQKQKKDCQQMLF